MEKFIPTLFPEGEPDLASVDFNWQEAFKIHLEQYGQASQRTVNLIGLIIRGDLEALKPCQLSGPDLGAHNFLLPKIAAYLNKQPVLDYFYSTVLDETQLSELTLDIKAWIEKALFWAAICNQLEIIDSYLANDPAALEPLSFEGKSITMLVAEIGHVKLFELLLSRPHYKNTEDRLLAPYVAKSGDFNILRSFISPTQQLEDTEQASVLDWSSRSERLEVLIPEILRYAALYSQINLIRYMLEEKMVDFRSVLTETINVGNAHLLSKLSTLKSEIENGEEVYKNILSNTIKTALKYTNEPTSVLDNNPCIKFLLEDPATALSVAAFRIAVSRKKTELVEKIFERPGVDIKALARLLDKTTGLPIAYTFPRNLEMERLLLSHVDLQDVLCDMILAKASLMKIRNVIYFNDHVLKRPPINKQALLDFGNQNRRKLITDSLKLEIALEKKLATAGTNSGNTSFDTLKLQVIATARLKGRHCSISKHPQPPESLKLSKDLKELLAFQKLTDPLQIAKLQKLYEKAYKKGFSKVKKEKLTLQKDKKPKA